MLKHKRIYIYIYIYIIRYNKNLYSFRGAVGTLEYNKLWGPNLYVQQFSEESDFLGFLLARASRTGQRPVSRPSCSSSRQEAVANFRISRAGSWHECQVNQTIPEPNGMPIFQSCMIALNI